MPAYRVAALGLDRAGGLAAALALVDLGGPGHGIGLGAAEDAVGYGA